MFFCNQYCHNFIEIWQYSFWLQRVYFSCYRTEVYFLQMIVRSSNQGFIPAKVFCTWPLLLSNDGPFLSVINISLPLCAQFMQNMPYVKLVCLSVFDFTNANHMPESI
jgi:hypothetical protein